MYESYLAGIFDGDGTFGINKKNNWNQHSGPHSKKAKEYLGGIWDADGTFYVREDVVKVWVRYQPFASITLTDAKASKIFRLLEHEFEFKCVHKRFEGHDRYKTAYRWQLSSQKACDFAKELAPYMIIKKERAELLASFPKKWNGMTKDLRKEYTEKQEAIYQQMKALNKRGT